MEIKNSILENKTIHYNANEKEINMRIRKDVYKMAVPVFIEQFFIMSIGVVNTIIASGIGKEAISAIGTVDSFNNIITLF